MKKVIATLLAAIMLISSFAVMASALSFEQFKAMYPDKVIFVFDPASFTMGTRYQGDLQKIDEGDIYKGMYALSGVEFDPDRYIQLPGTKTSDDAVTANWALYSDPRDDEGNRLLPTGSTYAAGSVFHIPNNKALIGQVIYFRAEQTAVEKESVLGKILVVFAKIIKALFGEDTARGFLELFVDMDLGIDIDIDAVFPPKAPAQPNP